MRARLSSITAKLVRQLLAYNPDTGAMTWRPRTPTMFKDGRGGHTKELRCRVWNGRYAGKHAGSVTASGDYLLVSIFDQRYLAHRLAYVIVTGKWPTTDIDHKNLNRQDNRWQNLRLATPSQNLANAPLRSDNTSGHKGVCWYKPSQKWKAQLRAYGVTKNLGYFASIEDAAAAYERAARAAFADFARTANRATQPDTGETSQ